MEHTRQYVEGLIQLANPSKKVLQLQPYFKIFDSIEDFIQDEQFVYYGTFNIGNGGSLSLSLFGSNEFHSEPSDIGITQPVLFTHLEAVKCSFMGIRLKVA